MNSMRLAVWALLFGACHLQDKPRLADASLQICGHPVGSLASNSYLVSMGAIDREKRSDGALERACKASDGRACAALAWRLRHANAKDPRALEVARRGCDLGDDQACTVLGDLYLVGMGGDDRTERMFEAFRGVCRTGDCSNLLGAYLFGCSNRDPSDDLQLASDKCEHGDSEGCGNLGYMFFGGHGTRRDDARGLRYFELSCQLRNAVGCANVGAAYRDADGSSGVARDDAKAATYFNKSCDLGNQTGCAMLGMLIADGRAPKDTHRATELLEHSCTARVGQACARLAKMYYQGDGLPADVPRARALLRRGCDDGVGGACTLLADDLYNGDHGPKDHVAAGKLFSRACDAEDQAGCLSFATLLLQGDGVTKDEARARKMFEKSCAADYAPGCARLAEVLSKGQGGPPDLSRAYTLGQKSCEGGVWSICRDVGVAYMQTAIRDVSLAEKLLRLGCDHAQEPACVALASVLLADGPREPDFAIQLLVRGCEHNNAEACVKLATAYAKGVGVDPNPGRAATLFDQACVAGDPQACAYEADVLLTLRGDPKRVFTLLDGACKKDVLVACKTLAVVYMEGSGTAIDFARANALFSRVCDNGDKEACQAAKFVAALVTTEGGAPEWVTKCDAGDHVACGKLIGIRCGQPNTQERNADFCMRMATRECDSGQLDTCAALGGLYLEGRATKVDSAAATRIFDAACEKGGASACYAAGAVRVESDKPRALRLFLRACDGKYGEGCASAGVIERQQHPVQARALVDKGCSLNSVRACALFGVMLAGAEGGPADSSRAKKLLGAACDAGNESACLVRKDLD